MTFEVQIFLLKRKSSTVDGIPYLEVEDDVCNQRDNGFWIESSVHFELICYQNCCTTSIHGQDTNGVLHKENIRVYSYAQVFI